MATTDDKAKPEGKTPRANYYDTEARKAALAEARLVAGLEDEIAMLRVLLREATSAEKPDHKVILRGTEALMRMVVAQYRLSPRASKHLADHMTALLNDLGDQMLPADR